MEGLLQLTPAHFVFEVTRGQPSTLRVRFSNVSRGRIAFRVRTRHSNQYCVRPPREILHVGETREVAVTQAALKLPADLRGWSDKFQIFVVPVDTPLLRNCTKDSVWDVATDDVVIKRKFEVRLRRAELPVQPGVGVPVPRTRAGSAVTRYVKVEPDEVRFRITPGVQAMSILKITNGFRCPIAFKAKVSELQRYRISPNRCVIGPGQAKVVAVYLEPFEVRSEELHTVEDKMLFLFARLDDAERRACSLDSVWGIVDEREYICKRYLVQMELAATEGEEMENKDSNNPTVQQEQDLANAACVVPRLTVPANNTVSTGRPVGTPPRLSVSPTPIATSASVLSMMTAVTGPSRGPSSVYSSPLPELPPGFWDPEYEVEDEKTEELAEAIGDGTVEMVVEGKAEATTEKAEEEDSVYVANPIPSFVKPFANGPPTLAQQLATLRMREASANI